MSGHGDLEEVLLLIPGASGAGAKTWPLQKQTAACRGLLSRIPYLISRFRICRDTVSTRRDMSRHGSPGVATPTRQWRDTSRHIPGLSRQQVPVFAGTCFLSRALLCGPFHTAPHKPRGQNSHGPSFLYIANTEALRSRRLRARVATDELAGRRVSGLSLVGHAQQFDAQDGDGEISISLVCE